MKINQHVVKYALFFILAFTSTSCDKSEDNKIEIKESPTIVQLTNVELLNEQLKNYKLSMSSIVNKRFSTKNKNDYYELSEEDSTVMINGMDALLSRSKSLMYSFGINDDEINALFTKDKDYRVILAALSIAYSFRISSKANITDCALEALGVRVFSSVREIFELGAKRAAKAILKQVATKVLGPIGVGFAVAEFAYCMNDHSFF